MDHYSVLGVNRTASDKEIKQAYRKLAMEHHPDRTGGDDTKFKQINEAYDVLKDPQKKAAYDNPQAQFNSNAFSDNFGNFNDIFSNMFGGGFQQRHGPRNKDISIPVKLSLEEVFSGKNLRLRYKTTRGIEEAEVTIPPYIQNGQTVQFRGLGDNAVSDFPRGNLNVLVNYIRHHYWNIDGPHLKAKETIPLISLLKGTHIFVKSLEGSDIKVNIPRGTKPGTTLSITGHGLPLNNRQRGNAYIKIDTVMPKLTEMQLLQLENIFGYQSN